MSDHKTEGLLRTMGLPQAVAMVVGIIIGASIFVQPSEITRLVPSVPGIFLVWLVSGVLTFFGALVCAELSSIFTRSGGVYVYLKEAFSSPVGFLWGWAMFWSVHSGIIAAVAVIFARYLAFFLPMRPIFVKLTAIAVILALSAVNYRGVRQGSTVQTVITLGKLLAIGSIILIGFLFGSSIPEHFVAAESPAGNLSFTNFLLALVAGLFAFGGWHMVTYSSDETKEPQKNIPRALMLGTLITTVCYIAMNAVYMYILPLDKVASSTRIAADAADVVLGYGGGAVMAALVVFSTFGALNGIILSGPRLYYSMARDGLLFHWVGDVHPRYRTPHKAITLQAGWSAVLVLTGTYRELFTRVVYTEWIFFGLMAVGLIILRRRPGVTRAYRIWGYPIVPAVFVIAASAIVINQVISVPRESIIGLSLVLAGLPVYHVWAGFKKSRR